MRKILFYMSLVFLIIGSIIVLLTITDTSIGYNIDYWLGSLNFYIATGISLSFASLLFYSLWNVLDVSYFGFNPHPMTEEQSNELLMISTIINVNTIINS